MVYVEKPKYGRTRRSGNGGIVALFLYSFLACLMLALVVGVALLAMERKQKASAQSISELLEATMQDLHHTAIQGYDQYFSSGTPAAGASGTASITTATGTLFQPVDCRRSLQDYAGSDTDPDSTDKILVRTDTMYPFLVSLHNQKFDPVRWDIYLYGRYYERALEELWGMLLLLHPTPQPVTNRQSSSPPHVVDVGGNIGYYSLYSASFGKSVQIDSFEPNPANVLRFCESVGINHWGGSSAATSSDAPHINIWEMGISKERGSLSFFRDKANPGAGRIVTDGEDKVTKPGLNQATPEHTVVIPVITLDDFVQERGWFDSPVTIVVMKIDVERHEAEVIMGATKLLQSGMVKNIFTEVGADIDKNLQIDALRILTNAGYRLAGTGNYRGPQTPSEWPHDDKLAENLIEFVNRKDPSGNYEHAYLNLWWSLDGKDVTDPILVKAKANLEVSSKKTATLQRTNKTKRATKALEVAQLSGK
jgi:FkbM family methyltransferase